MKRLAVFVVLAACDSGPSANLDLNVTWSFDSGDCASNNVKTVHVSWGTGSASTMTSDFECSAGTGKLQFANSGAAPTRIHIRRPPDFSLVVEPEDFVLAPNGKQEVAVTIQASVLGESEAHTQLQWTVEDNPRPDIAVVASVRRGGNFLASLTDRFRKK